jgi:hypothetical protein
LRLNCFRLRLVLVCSIVFIFFPYFFLVCTEVLFNILCNRCLVIFIFTFSKDLAKKKRGITYNSTFKKGLDQTLTMFCFLNIYNRLYTDDDLKWDRRRICLLFIIHLSATLTLPLPLPFKIIIGVKLSNARRKITF